MCNWRGRGVERRLKVLVGNAAKRFLLCDLLCRSFFMLQVGIETTAYAT